MQGQKDKLILKVAGLGPVGFGMMDITTTCLHIKHSLQGLIVKIMENDIRANGRNRKLLNFRFLIEKRTSERYETL